MAPYRPPNSRSTRAGRTQNEHDVFEGLPIRQWRLVERPIGPQPQAQVIQSNEEDWPELPMPRDSHLLSEMSQALLRTARAGKLHRPKPPPVSEDKETAEETEEVKETQPTITVRQWTKVPRHLEEPEREYLAKRKAGMPAGSYTPYTGAMRKTKIRRINPDGSTNVWDCLVPVGISLADEITEAEAGTSTTTIAAAGTIVEGVGVANEDGIIVAHSVITNDPSQQATPQRRRPPPPRRKPKKGPGRGKKRVTFTGPEGATGDAPREQQGQSLDAPASKMEGESGAQSEDTPMADAHDGDEEDEEGDEIEEDDDREDGEISPTPDVATSPTKATERPAPTPANQPAPAIKGKRVTLSTQPKQDPPLEREPSSSPELPLATTHSRQNSLNKTPAHQTPTAPLPVSSTTVVHSVSPTSSDPTPPRASSARQQPSPQEGTGEVRFPDGDVDLFESLERHLEESSGK